MFSINISSSDTNLNFSVYLSVCVLSCQNPKMVHSCGLMCTQVLVAFVTKLQSVLKKKFDMFGESLECFDGKRANTLNMNVT